MKEIMSGNTRLVFYTSFLDLSDEEQAQWFEEELEKGNPVAKNIEAVVNKAYREIKLRKLQRSRENEKTK